MVFMLALCCLSCARMPASWQKEPGEELFVSAQRAFEQKSYSTALKLYRQYVNDYPQAPRVPAALVKTGQIELLQGDFPAAAAVFRRVMESYPDTGESKQAGVELLAAYYFQGRYDQVRQYAGEVLAMKLSGPQLFRANLMFGDSSLALKFPKAAYDAFLKALEYAGGNEEAQVIMRLKTAIALLDPATISAELRRLNGKPPSVYLMYQQGVNAMEAGSFDEAVDILSRLAAQFPEHEYAGQARQLLEKIKAAGEYEKETVGCLLPLSGKYEPFGKRALNGIELALAEFYRKTGVSSVRLIIRDTASDSETAASAARELVSMKVSAIIGPLMTAEAVAPIAQEARIPIITLTQKTGITNAGDYVFRNFLTPEIQVKTLLSYAADHLGMKRFAILYPSENYGETFMNLFWDEVNAHGGRVVGVESYDPAQTDFADAIKKLVGLYYDIPEDLKEEKPVVPLALYNSDDAEGRGAVRSKTDKLIPGLDSENWKDDLANSFSNEDPDEIIPEKRGEDEFEPVVDFDAIFIPDSANKAGLIIPQLSYYDVSDVLCLGTNLWHSEKFIDMIRYHSQQAVFSDGFFENSRSAPVAQFVASYKKTYGDSPGFIEGVSYDTAMILFETINRKEVRFRSQVQKALLEMRPFQGVTGITSFAPNGEAVKQIYLLSITRNRITEIPK